MGDQQTTETSPVSGDPWFPPRLPEQATAPLTHSYWAADSEAERVDLTLGELLDACAAEAPETIALVEGAPELSERRRWTYAQLRDEAVRVAHMLLSHVSPGDHVAVCAPNLPEWEILQFGAAYAGLTLVAVNPALGPDEIRYLLTQSASSAVVTSAKFRDRNLLADISAMQSELPELRTIIDIADVLPMASRKVADRAELPVVRPNDPAMIQYSSGTTGFPKGAVLTHGGLTSNAWQAAQSIGLAERCVWVSPMPMFHIGGCVVTTLWTMCKRGTHVMFVWDPSLALELLESCRATVFSAVPTMLLAMREHPDFRTRDLSSLAVLLSGGTAVAPDLVRRVEREFGARFVMIFGQTEHGGVICHSRPGDSPEDKAGTVGQPGPLNEVKIAAPGIGDPVACGHGGEICVRSVSTMTSYFNQPLETAETVDEQGWLHTGDLGVMDTRGYVRITGRLKDMVIRGGENLFPREVEDVLLAHPQVNDAAVIGVPDDYWGEEQCAFVRPLVGSRPSDEDLAGWVRRRLARHKVPRHWRFVDELPVTASGKVQKFLLREQFIAEQTTRGQDDHHTAKCVDPV